MVGRIDSSPQRPFLDSWASLALAALAPVPLLATLLLVPHASWRVPLGFLVLLWAPGHVVLALVYPLGAGALRPLERAALSLVLGLLAAPVAALLVSAAWGFRAEALAAAYAAALPLLALGAASRGRWRAAPARERPDPTVPSTGVAVALAGGALVLVAALVAVPAFEADAAPASLALLGADGTPESIPREVAPGTPVGLQVEVTAGDTGFSGVLRVHVVSGASAEAIPVLHRELHLASRHRETVPLSLPLLPLGEHQIVVRLDGPEPRQVHAWITVAEEESR
ncbi:MAG TPA: DUF1616 domain-containing protein [Candidatus Thermoplasmatota archaeon]|nr:DUF1616 domain-containing protein [Candidatus Thermoplasmatota archaeon]